MKVLIADDEFHVIEAICLLVPWDELGIGQVFTAGTAAEAKEILRRESPELVITDIVMPDETGIDLMRHIARELPASKVIAISGHNDFDYVRTMLTCGSIDYLLKPLDADQLIRAVTRAIDAWNEDYQRSQNRMRIQSQITSLSARRTETLLSRMLRREGFDKACRELAGINPGLSGGSFLLLFYDAAFFPGRESGFPELLGRFEEEARAGLPVILFHGAQNRGAYLLISNEKQWEALPALGALSSRLFSGPGYPFHLGRSDPFCFPDGFPDACAQARDAFLSADARGVPELLSAYSGAPAPLTEPAQELSRRMLSVLLTGNRERIAHTAAQWLDALLPDGPAPLSLVQHILDRFQKLLSLWSALLEKQSPHLAAVQADFTIHYQDLLDERYLFSPALLREAIVAKIERLSDEMKRDDGADLFQQIAYYMELNYADPFSLAEYAKLFYLNKDYMCRQFKKKFGVSMVSYFNQIRIEKAKELIRATRQSFGEIAFQVGFQDEKYFTRQFKQLTSLTPRDYRNLYKTAGGPE